MKQYVLVIPYQVAEGQNILPTIGAPEVISLPFQAEDDATASEIARRMAKTLSEALRQKL